MDFLWGILGILTVFAIAFLLSTNRKAISLRTVLGGLAIQLTFAFLVLKWELGRQALTKLTEVVSNIIDYANDGSIFLFGELASGEGAVIFAFQVLTIIIFFSALISVLYYIGVMQWFIRIIGGALHKALGTSKTESLSATANIFVGQTEAPLVIRPYVSKMTQSELFAVMTGGLASVAGSVLFGYHLMGVPLEYLLAASFMAAPAGLIMAKVLVPETDKSRSDESVELEADSESANVIDAAANGASVGLKLALNVGAMLMAFIGLIALINGFLGFVGGLVGYEALSLNMILGAIFAPIAFAIGIPWSEAVTAGQFIGTKIVVNEFVAYANFTESMDQLSEKTVAIISFALCGFANLSSLGILLGGLGGIAPERRGDIAKMGIRAIIAGTLASLLSASIAGMLF
ncbi:NupC/NupG family nucleoside CNT transporter [Caldalkalibacillus salinus]|uniref:NupC/NupG family nucleoside CNT transporter n=1 Tax=Caldalkalibacillus salinus TaxID=2803787 RepID=UPI0019229EB4